MFPVLCLTGDEAMKTYTLHSSLITHSLLIFCNTLLCCVTGDEVMKTHHGNNNWYGHDTEWTQMVWEWSEEAAGLQVK